MSAAGADLVPTLLGVSAVVLGLEFTGAGFHPQCCRFFRGEGSEDPCGDA